MIVIPRKVGESIVLWDNVIVTIVEIRGDKVQLGIEHPPEVTVHRREVLETLQKAESAKPR